MRTFWLGSIGLALLGLTAWNTSARAETMQFHADLSGPKETPPTTSKGTGEAEISYDTATKKLTWSVTYSGLTGAATAAHFHGPAAVGVAAAVEVPLTGALASPVSGSATLTDSQAKDLLSGNMYFNIHTAENKAGEIRGQVEKGAGGKAG